MLTFPLFVVILKSPWTILVPVVVLSIFCSWTSWSSNSSTSCSVQEPSFLVSSVFSSLFALALSFWLSAFSSHFFFRAWMIGSIDFGGTVSSTLSNSAKSSALPSFSDSSSLASVDSSALWSKTWCLATSERSCIWEKRLASFTGDELSSISKDVSKQFSRENEMEDESLAHLEDCRMVAAVFVGTNSDAFMFRPLWEILSSNSVCSIPNKFPSSLHRLINSSHNPWQLPMVLSEKGSPTTAMSDWARVRAVLSNFGSDSKYK